MRGPEARPVPVYPLLTTGIAIRLVGAFIAVLQVVPAIPRTILPGLTGLSASFVLVALAVLDYHIFASTRFLAIAGTIADLLAVAPAGIYSFDGNFWSPSAIIAVTWWLVPMGLI